jgi:hypothetical protein
MDDLRFYLGRDVKCVLAAPDAVEEAIQLLGGHLDDKERKRLLEEAEEDFKQRLASFRAEKEGLEAKTKNLQDQLHRAEKLLEEERLRAIAAERFTVSLKMSKRL